MTWFDDLHPSKISSPVFEPRHPSLSSFGPGLFDDNRILCNGESWCDYSLLLSNILVRMLIETFVKSLKAFLHNKSSDAVSRFALWVAPCVHYHLGGMVVLMFYEKNIFEHLYYRLQYSNTEWIWTFQCCSIAVSLELRLTRSQSGPLVIQNFEPVRRKLSPSLIIFALNNNGPELMIE